MGIFIHLAISKSVTKEEWERVYEETLQLIKHLPLADRREVKIHGFDTVCLVRSEEYEDTYGYFDRKTRVGWNAVGDYQSMRRAENYYLPRDIVGENEIEKGAGDAIFEILPVYMDYDRQDERFFHVYDIFGGKTQGEPYHIYLLAVTALIEARLGTKAVTYGDITRGQLKKAVEIANKYLDNKIDMPDRCYVDRLLKRVSKFPLSSGEQLAVLEEFYLGTKDAEFGKYVRQMFSIEAIDEYWKYKFKNNKIGTIGFDMVFNEYLLWGFDLGKVCQYISFEDKDGNLKYEEFIKRVMDAKLHIKEKNCEDSLNIDQEEERPYGIATLFAQFAFAGARNKKIDRYIPIEDIKRDLVSVLGDKCDVESIIDKYLEEEAKQIEINISSQDTSEEDIKKAVEQDPAEAFNQIMDIKCEELKKEQEKYDIDDCGNLIFYENGDTIHPGLVEAIAKSRKFLDSLLKKEKLKELLEKEAKECCEWLVKHNRYILIRDKDWEKIFTDIENDKEVFGRYYTLFSVALDSRNLLDMGTAFVVNDDLYSYSKILADELDEE